MTPLTRHRLVKADLMRRRGYSWEWIARRLKCDPDTIRRRLDPEWAERRKLGVQEARRIKAGGKISSRNLPPDIPNTVLAARDAALDHIPTIHEFILGDPPPGRSALDRKST